MIVEEQDMRWISLRALPQPNKKIYKISDYFRPEKEKPKRLTVSAAPRTALVHILSPTDATVNIHQDGPIREGVKKNLLVAEMYLNGAGRRWEPPVRNFWNDIFFLKEKKMQNVLKQKNMYFVKKILLS